jgi:hypothetical protein
MLSAVTEHVIKGKYKEREREREREIERVKGRVNPREISQTEK